MLGLRAAPSTVGKRELLPGWARGSGQELGGLGVGPSDLSLQGVAPFPEAGQADDGETATVHCP